MLHSRTGPQDARRLIRLYRELTPNDRDTLLAFATFLAQRASTDLAPDDSGPRAPQDIPRPEHESVIGAIRRLSRTYDMLDPGMLLNETSALMSAHVLQGRDASAVIDELEALFARHYQDHRATLAPDDRSLQT